MNDNTAIARREDRTPAAPKPPVQAGGALAALVPQDMDQAYRISVALASAGDMVPKHFQGNPNATMAAILRGMEIGLNPMQALSSIAVINGRASLWGDALPALMQRAGHHVDVEVEGDGDKMVATATLTRGDTGKQIVRRFSMADAKKAGLTGKQGPWQQYPQRMVSMRARSWAIRDGAADTLMGLSIADEAQDYGPNAARDVTPTAPKPGRARYVEADPIVDEVYDGEVVADMQDDQARDDIDQLVQSTDKAIRRELTNGAPFSATLAFYDAELGRILGADPERHATLMAEYAKIEAERNGSDA